MTISKLSIGLLRSSRAIALLAAMFSGSLLYAQGPSTNGLQFWFKADAGTVTNSSGFVTEWDDQSGNGFNAFQSDETRAPKFVPNAINGKPVLRFDGSDADTDYLDADSSAVDLTGDNATFAVIRIDDTTVYNAIWAKTLVNLPAPTDYYLIQGSGLPQLYRGDGTSSGIGNVTGAKAVRVDEYVVIGFQQQGSTITHFLNGLTNGTGDLPANASPLDGGTPLRIGSRDNLETKLKGDMAELLIYNQALSDSDLTATINYLRTKYGILNSKPNVAITSPASNVSSNAPADFTVTVNASDDDGSVARVDLLVNGSVVSSAIAPPYSYRIRIESASTNVITAIATDNKDATSVSAPITLAATSTGPAPELKSSSHLKLWLKGDAGITLGPSGGVVEWKDQSGNGNDAEQVDEAFAPTMGDLNGHPAVYFDAVEDYMDVADSDSISITGDIASFFVVRFDDYADYRAVWGKTSLNQPRPTDYYLRPGTGVPVVFRGLTTDDGQNLNASVAGIGGVPANLPVLLGFQQAGTTMTHYLNGSPFGSGEITLTPQDADTPLKIGSRDDFATKMKGDIAELLIYDAALSEDDLVNLRQYLAGKYSLPVVFPENTGPLVVFSGVAEGATYPLGTNLTLSATASDSDGSIVRVEFRANGTLISTVTNEPYTTTLALATPGSVTVSATAIDNLQMPSTASVTINVSGTSSAPIPLDGLALWLRADSGVSTNSAGAVTSWADGSPNFNTVSQTDGTKAPALIANAINGKPALQFDGANDFLEAPASSSLAITGDLTTLFVVNIDDYVTYRAIWAKTAGPGGNLPAPTDYYLLPSTGIPRAFHGATGGFNSVDGTSPLPMGAFSVAGWELAGTTLTHYLDGAENGSGETPSAGGDAGESLRIGTRGDNFTKLKGSLAELVIYNRALTDDERAQVTSYLQSKYGLGGGGPDQGSTLALAAGTGNTLVFSWPAEDNSQLESSLTVGPDAAWAAVNEAVVQNNGQNTVTIQATDSARFFRLRR